jgi:hypothetical protein
MDGKGGEIMKRGVFFLTIFLLFPAVVLAQARCFSDYGCPPGYDCVKEPFHADGVCMQQVDRFGVPSYKLPSPDSVLPNIHLEGECRFDTDCPIGFRCDIRYKVCVKRM